MRSDTGFVEVFFSLRLIFLLLYLFIYSLVLITQSTMCSFIYTREVKFSSTFQSRI